ncbi:MAG: carboxypeptidase-like regulatory domain-containing protein, partial [Bacteroidota bacterium]
MGRKFFTVLLVGLFLQALPDQAHAQTGRLAGTVTDASTGEPIPGVTVILDGTTQGAASDAEGRYVIIGITPDVYNVRFSFVGYTPKVIQNVQITSARTTTLDAQLSSEVVEGEELIVEAERPVVDQNQTTSRSLVSGEELSNLPVRSVEDA